MGTLMELEWAYIFSVPVIGIIGRDTSKDVRDHPWVKNNVTHPCTSLKAALELIEQYFQARDEKAERIQALKAKAEELLRDPS